jgi:hypothetical protein
LRTAWSLRVLVTMTSARITVKATPGITPRQARDARARAWRFVFDCYAKKTATSEEKPASPLAGRGAKKGIKDEFHAAPTPPY